MLRNCAFRNRLNAANCRFATLSSKHLEQITQIQFQHGVINERLRDEIWDSIVDPEVNLPDKTLTSQYLQAYRRSYLSGTVPSSSILADFSSMTPDRRVALHEGGFMNLIQDSHTARTLTDDTRQYMALLRESQTGSTPLVEVEMVLWEVYHESMQLGVAAAQKLLNFNLDEANRLRLMFGRLLIEKSAEYDDIQGSQNIMRDLKLPASFERYLIPSYYRVGNTKDQLSQESKLKVFERGGNISAERKNTYLSLLVSAVRRFDATEINRILRQMEAEKWSLRPRDIATLYRSLHQDEKFDVAQHLRILENFMRHSTPFQLLTDHEALSKDQLFEQTSPLLLKLSKDVLEQSPEELPSLLSFLATRQAIKTSSNNRKRIHWERVRALEERFVDYSMDLYRRGQADPIYLGSVFFAQFEEKFQPDRLVSFERLYTECSEEDKAELLAVFADNISHGFPNSEELTRKQLGKFSDQFVDFILESKIRATVQVETTDQPFISINDLLLSESTSISAQFSQEIATSFVNWSLRQRHANGMSALNLLLRKMDMNGDRDQAVRLIKDVLLAAWSAMDPETFQQKQFHNIFNHIVYYPLDYSNYLMKQEKYNSSINQLINHQYVDFPSQSERNKFVDLPTEMRNVLILEPLGQLFGYLDESLQLIKDDPDEVEVNELASMVTLIATQPHIRFKDIAKIGKPEYLIGLPPNFIVDLIRVLSKSEKGSALCDLFGKNVEILKVCSDQTRLLELLPKIYDSVLTARDSVDDLLELHDMVTRYVADASYDSQPKLTLVEVIGQSEKISSNRCFRGRQIRRMGSIPDLALYGALAKYKHLTPEDVNKFPESKIPMLKEKLKITFMNRCETGEEIVQELAKLDLNLPLDVANIRVLLVHLIRSQDRLFSKKIMSHLLSELMNKLNLNANAELFTAACLGQRFDMVEQFGARLTPQNTKQFEDFLSSTFHWETDRLGFTSQIDLSKVPVDQNPQVIRNLTLGCAKIEDGQVRAAYIDALMEKYIYFLRSSFDSIRTNAFVEFLQNVKEICGDLGDTKWLYYYNNYSRVDHILDQASKDLNFGTRSIPQVFKETLTRDEFPPGFTKQMKMSIYQDIKNSSSGELFHSNDEFEKNFIELVRLEKNLTGRLFDMSQRQFTEFIDRVHGEEFTILRRLSIECSQRFREKLDQVETSPQSAKG